MDAVKRVLAGLFLLGLSAAGVYGYTLSERERIYRQLIADGEAALARDNTGAAIEAFSGAIPLKDDSMLGYLKRGQTYRRRGEFVAAIRDLRRASDIDPAATRPLEELGDAYLADTPHRYAAAPERFQAYGKLGNRAPPALAKLAFERCPDQRSAYVALGRVWVEIAQARGDRLALSKAIEALEGAVGSDDSSEALTLFGRALLLTSDEETAERMLQDATQRQPVEPLAFYYLSEAAERLRHYDVARRALLDFEVLRGDEPDARRRTTHAAPLGALPLKSTH